MYKTRQENRNLWAATGGKIPKSPEEWERHFDHLFNRPAQKEAKPVDDATWRETRFVGNSHRGAFKGVHTSYLRMVDQAVKRFAAELGIEPPLIRWHEDGPSNGWVVDDGRWDEINLLTKTALAWPRGWEPLQWLIAHECRHLWALKNCRHYGDRDREEEDAELWATSQTGYKGFHPYYLRRP
jgi:hypothetical protein